MKNVLKFKDFINEELFPFVMSGGRHDYRSKKSDNPWSITQTQKEELEDEQRMQWASDLFDSLLDPPKWKINYVYDFILHKLAYKGLIEKTPIGNYKLTKKGEEEVDKNFLFDNYFQYLKVTRYDDK